MALLGKTVACALPSLLLVLTALALTNPAHSENLGKVMVRGNTSPALGRATLVGHSDPNRVLDIVVGLNLHNEQELRDLIVRQTDPTSPDYHHFLTPTEFNERFAPTQSDAESVSRHLESQGLTVLQVTPNRLLVHARGTVAQLEKAFEVTINDYALKGERHFSNDRDPSVPAELSATIKSVAGLTSFGRFHSAASGRPIASSTTAQVIYTPFQIATGYNFPNLNNANHGKTTYDGAGTTVAVIAPYTYDAAAVSFFFQYYGLNRTGSLTTVAINGGSSTVTFEDTLDVEQIGAQAMGANIVVYDTPDSTFANVQLIYNQIVTDNSAQVVSSSWVACEADSGSAFISSSEATFEQGVAQGMTFFVGSGDLGAFACPGTPATLAVDYPSSSQYFTSVGGTNVYLDSNNHITSETVWDDSVGASGGGQSSTIFQPSWQKGAGVPTSGTRDIADVAFDASDSTAFYAYYQGGWYYGYGTSFGGPNWAALWALGIQALNGARTGNAAPSMYQIGGNDHHTYSSTFHDVTTGNNGFYNATTGWDYPTGWGSPNGAHLVNWMKKHL